MDLQSLCEIGQAELMRMEYLHAETALVEAEELAIKQQDYDTLARLYMPLQEARRQRRQRCGEGVVCMDLIAANADDRLDGRHVVENYPRGQLLVAGWASIEPALQVRELQQKHELYVETFLAAAYPAGDGRVIAIVPLADVKLPDASPRSIDQLINLLPAHTIVLSDAELPQGSVQGTPETFSRVMKLWERLHTPFLAAADATREPKKKIDAYRKAIRVDYACELAHQKLSDTARGIHPEGRSSN